MARSVRRNKLRAATKRRPAAPARRRRWPFVVAGLVVALSLGVAASVTAYLGWRRAAPPSDRPNVAVSWPEGLDAAEAAALLADLGLTNDALWMEIFLRLRDGPSCFTPGPHLLPTGATPAELLAALCRSEDRPAVKVTIPEGFHRFAIASRLEKAGVVSSAAFLAATGNRPLLHRLEVDEATVAHADTAEGYLFPATYQFPIDSTPEAVLTRLVAEARQRFARLSERHADGWARLKSDLGFGRREVIILASMVEKEAAVAEERAVIASVFLNRLRDPAFPHLQSDPTAVYGCLVMPAAIAACEGFEGRATGAINRDRANAYSTYVTRGLPPGPIANPGEASIAAVLAPADTPYRYFAAKGQGRHTFSETYEQHLEAVKQLRELRR
jgi:UPF0755 protein